MNISSLRRVTRDGQWIPEIDGLRFIAILSVFLFHLIGELMERSGRIIPVEPGWMWLHDILTKGDRGVRLFFVISGMILAKPFARQYLLGKRPVSLARYYMRRVTRLEPPYVLSVILFVLLLLVQTHGHLEPGTLTHAFASLFYAHTLIYGHMSPINMVSWSLEVEIQFYVFAPVFMALFRIPGKLARRSLMLVLIVAIGFAQMPFSLHGHFYLSILYYLNYFLAGLLVADIWILDLDTMRSGWWWDVAGFGAIALMFTMPINDTAHLLLPIIFGMACLASMRSLLFRRFVATPAIAVIGGMCYSIYLLHFTFIAVFFKATRYLIVPGAPFFANYAIQLVVTGIPVLLCCMLYFRLVEQPCMDPDWPSKLWHRVTGRSGAEVAVLDTDRVTDGPATGRELPN